MIPSQLVIRILECANGWGPVQAFSIHRAVKFPLSPIHAVFRIPSSGPRSEESAFQLSPSQALERI